MRYDKIADKYIYLVAFLLILSSYYTIYYDDLYRVVYPYSDLAADMLLTDEIYRGVLLTGHYSRFEFHHPGAFFFYLNALYEQLFGSLFPSRANVWLFGSIVANGLFLTLSIYLTHSIIKPQRYRVISTLLLSILLMLLFVQYQDLWMPSRVVAPYLAYLLTLPLLVRREYRYLPLSMLLSGILIHGYVVLPIMTLPPLVVALLYSLLIDRRAIDSKEWIYILSALLTGVLFLSPMLYDLYLNGSYSNISKIIQAAQESRPHSSWIETFEFVGMVIPTSLMISVMILLSIVIYRSSRYRVEIYRIVAIYLVVGAIFVLYHHSAPKPLYEFVGRYIYSLPLAIYMILFSIVWGIGRYSKIVALVSMIYLVSDQYSTTQIYREYEAILQLSRSIIEATIDDGVAHIDYTRHGDWEVVAGLLLELEREGYEACVVQRHMAFLYTSARVCREKSRANTVLKNDRDGEHDIYSVKYSK